MKYFSFSAGIVVAAALAVMGSALLQLGQWVVGHGVGQAVVPLIGFCYANYLVNASPVRAGRLVAYATLFVSTCAILFIETPVFIDALLVTGLIWAVRSVYFHERPLIAFLDLLCSGFALLLGLWAAL